MRAQEHESQKHQQHHKNHDGMKHSFADTVRWTKVFDAEDRDSWQRPQEVVALLEITPGMTVADIGAGTGYFLEHLATAVGSEGRVLGLDVEPAMVAFMHERARQEGWTNVSPQQIPGSEPGLEQASVDRILIVNTWHHIGSRTEYSKQLRSALRAGGTILVVDYTLDSPDGPPARHRLPAEQIVEELEQGGLRAEIVSQETLPNQFVVRARQP